jgi:hypothetical protein
MDRKPWAKPELIVLVRGRPEEAVLDKCRRPSESGPTGKGCKTGGTPCSSNKGS